VIVISDTLSFVADVSVQILHSRMKLVDSMTLNEVLLLSDLLLLHWTLVQVTSNVAKLQHLFTAI
jgi:hypothetical protein